MPLHNISLLSTRPLQESIITAAAERHVIIDALSFIETADAHTAHVKSVLADLSGKPVVAIFTSMNAVTAVTGLIPGQRPAWKIFCIGAATKKLIVDFFGESAVAGTAADAASLADVIIEKNISSAVFFCGSQRRNELPDKLKQRQIALQEIEVYKTTEIRHHISKRYNGIIFFSPSAVRSFFSNNTLPAETILFAIGGTTAGALKTYTANKVIVSEQPEKELLVEQAMDYFRKDQHID